MKRHPLSNPCRILVYLRPPSPLPCSLRHLVMSPCSTAVFASDCCSHRTTTLAVRLFYSVFLDSRIERLYYRPARLWCIGVGDIRHKTLLVVKRTLLQTRARTLDWSVTHWWRWCVTQTLLGARITLHTTCLPKTHSRLRVICTYTHVYMYIHIYVCI